MLQRLADRLRKFSANQDDRKSTRLGLLAILAVSYWISIGSIIGVLLVAFQIAATGGSINQIVGICFILLIFGASAAARRFANNYLRK